MVWVPFLWNHLGHLVCRIKAPSCYLAHCLFQDNIMSYLDLFVDIVYLVIILFSLGVIMRVLEENIVILKRLWLILRRNVCSWIWAVLDWNLHVNVKWNLKPNFDLNAYEDELGLWISNCTLHRQVSYIRSFWPWEASYTPANSHIVEHTRKFWFLGQINAMHQCPKINRALKHLASPEVNLLDPNEKYDCHNVFFLEQFLFGSGCIVYIGLGFIDSGD